MPQPNEIRALERIALSDSVDDDLDDLSAGELEPDRERALEARAAQDSQLRGRVEAHRPLTPIDRERIASAIAPRRSRLPVALVAIVGLAAAAAIAIAVLPRASDPPLPEYAIEIDGAAQARDRPGASLEPGARIEIRLRPARATDCGIDAAIFVRERGAWTRLPVEPEIASTGAVRIAGVVGRGAWRLPAGRTQMIAVVTSGRMPAASEIDRVRAGPSLRRVELALDLR